MAAYDGQRNYGANRNFMSSFPRNDYGSVPEDRSMYMRRPFERDAQMYQRYDDNRTGSFSSRPQPSFSRFDDQTRGTTNSMDRQMNMGNAGNLMANRPPTHNTFSRSEFGGQNFQRQEFGDKPVFRGSNLNERNAFSRSDLGNREMFSTSDFTRNEMFSRPEVGNVNMYSRPPVRGGAPPGRPMGSGNMFPRPQMSSGGSAFPRQPRFDCGPMSRFPMPRMQYPYGGGANQSSTVDWNHWPNWRTRNTSGVAAEKNPFAAVQQNKPKFKPAKKKPKKRNRIPLKLKDDGKKLKPWMTDELYVEVKKKNEMYFKAKAADSTELWQEFRLQRNKVSTLIKDAKVKGGFLVRKRREDEEDDGKERPYSCDTCDRAFAEESKLEEHLKDHKKCEIDGCQFEAHPKIVEMHKKLQHDTGYASIISKLDNAAEIEKWRNQRKSHFPTLENVKKRQAEQEERFARGELLETKDFGKFKKRRCEGQFSRSPPKSTGYKSARGRWGRQKGRFREGQDRLSNGKLKTETVVQEDSISDSDDESHITLPKFPGICVFTIVNTVDMKNSTILQSTETSDLKCFGLPSPLNSQPVNIPADPLTEQEGQPQNLPLPAFEDRTTLTSVSVVSKINEELVSTREQVHLKEVSFSSESNSLSCVLNDQNGNDQESEDEGPSVEPVVKQVETTCQVADFVPQCTGDEQKEPLDKSIVKSRSMKNAQTNQEQSSRLNGGFVMRHRGNLLEKLLANDIRHERNVILQCIRYTVNNNFFGIAGQRSSRS